MGRPPSDPVIRFWGYVNKEGTVHPEVGQCWEWTGGLINGYGQFQVKDPTSPYAHRYSWKVHYGCNPPDCVLHHCDNRKCVNPDHLFIGTKADNTMDCVSKERHARGEKINTAVQTEKSVLVIRWLYLTRKYTQKDLAKMFNTTQVNISRIVKRQTWKHV